MTNNEIEARRVELEEMAQIGGFTEEMIAEWKALYNLEMDNNMANAIAIAESADFTAYINRGNEGYYDLNTKEDNEWESNEYTLENAMKAFKAFAKAHEIKTVKILPYLLNIEEIKEIDNERIRYRQEEMYADACMAEQYGDPTLMKRYENEYGIEKDYGPSNPWDAPGMCVEDFIKGVRYC